MGKRRYNSHIHLITRREGPVRFTLRTHYPREKRPRYTRTGRWTLRREKSLTTTGHRTTTHIILNVGYFYCNFMQGSIRAICVKNKLLLNFMFCCPFISIYACNETNPMHYLSSVDWVTTPLNVSGLLARRQQWNFHSIQAGRQSYCHTYTLLPPDDGLRATPKHVQV
jgi:hypothetical protein